MVSHYGASRSHSDTSLSVRLLWTSDHPDEMCSTWQHTTLTTEKYPYHRRDSNPQSQRAAADARLKPCELWDRPVFTNNVTFPICYIKGVHIFQRSRRHLKSLGIRERERRQARSVPRNETLLGATVKMLEPGIFPSLGWIVTNFGSLV